VRGKFAHALLLSREALEILEAILGKQHEQIAIALEGIAFLQFKQKKYVFAIQNLEKAVTILELIFNQEHPFTADFLVSMAQIYQIQGNYPKAKALYSRALKIYKNLFDSNHHKVIRILEQYNTVSTKVKQKSKKKH